MTKEIDNLHSYNTFKDIGTVKYVDGYKTIIVNFIFVVKHDLCHKACLVSGGHLTEPTSKASYSSVVSLRSLHICLVAAELNGLKPMVGDFSSAYLEAFTQENVCFTANAAFGLLQGHTSSLTKHYMAYKPLVLAVTNALLILFTIWVILLVLQTMMYGLETVSPTMSMCVFMLMAVCTCSKTPTYFLPSSFPSMGINLLVLANLPITLEVTLSVAVMVPSPGELKPTSTKS
jgi:hypothetical protein